MNYSITLPKKRLSEEQFFMLMMLVVNAGNYLYNLVLGRIVSPAEFADIAILITFLLVLSFIGMTFQIITSKYAVLFDIKKLPVFIEKITKAALLFGVFIGVLIFIFNKDLQTMFQTKTASMFVFFGVGIPLYFLMCVNRGLYQGKNKLYKMAITYHTEMIARLAITVIFLFLFPNLETSTLVAIGITISFIFGLLPFQKRVLKKVNTIQKEVLNTRNIIVFFALTAFYEFTQIIINNSDIILVKHYFANEEAGLYASLALIGRAVYFVAWMFVMMLLPKVIQLKKEGKNTVPLLMKYVSYIALLSFGIVSFTYLFPELVVNLMFGEKYISIAFLLWKYALATSIFAIANLLAYYFLSINQFIPVIVSALLGFTQIGLIVFFHKSLEQVVEMQIIAMIALLFFQLCYFFYHNKKQVRLS